MIHLSFPSGVRLSVDNVFKVLKKIDKDWQWVAEKVLGISSSKCQLIKQNSTTTDELFTHAIRFWMKRDVVASWRFLIWILDVGNYEGLADEIRNYAEPLLGEGCMDIHWHIHQAIWFLWS